MHPHTTTTVHEVCNTDQEARKKFCELIPTWWACWNNISHTVLRWRMFHLSGHVNFQNNRFPTLIHKMSLHDGKVGVRFAVTATGITGPVYPQTINSHWGNIFWYHILNTYDYNGINALFQQGNATAHTPNNSIHCLKRTFGDTIISRELWTPRSPWTCAVFTCGEY